MRPPCHPHPFELMSAPTVLARPAYDPASREWLHDAPPGTVLDRENTGQNLFWPFRLFVDSDSGRVLLLTHRGALWQLGTEQLADLGEACGGDADCGVGRCVDRQVQAGGAKLGLCCDLAYCGPNTCTTCRAAEAGTPEAKDGTCAPLPSGTPAQRGVCGDGPCAGVCSGEMPEHNDPYQGNAGYRARCDYEAGRPCGALSCTDGKMLRGCAADRAAYVLYDQPVACAAGLCDSSGSWCEGSVSQAKLGEACRRDAECLEGFCRSGVCCGDQHCATSSAPCTTCNGSRPGTCEAAPRGTPSPHCGSGQCAATCSGDYPTKVAAGRWEPTCAFDEARACDGTVCTDGLLPAHCAADSNACLRTRMPCPNGLSCTTDGTACERSCTDRLDCAGPYARCTENGAACVPDEASVLAGELGIEPNPVDLPRLRTPHEVAQLFIEQGLEADESGRVLYPGTIAGVQFMFDPNKQTPLAGFRLMMQRLEACMLMKSDPDGCVAGMPRCAGEQPWLGDPAGNDCWPESCAARYLEKRKAGGNIPAAIKRVLDHSCYPDLQEMLSR